MSRGKTSISFLPPGFAVEQSRRQGNRPPRRNILIVCEGTKTEPNYFEAFRKKLVGGEGDRVEVIGLGDNTLSLVEKARELVEARRRSDKPPFYFVWVVFDKDDFPDSHFDNAILTIAQEDEKFKAGECPHWYAAWSNEAFELWYLLHFRDALGGPKSRFELCEMLSEHFKADLGIPDGYHKNDPMIFDLLYARMDHALIRAERAFARWDPATPPHLCNPASRVFELVKFLRLYS